MFGTLIKVHLEFAVSEFGKKEKIKPSLTCN
uniref:Uncharacterized protein n=1 Tax=Ciona intestinalis TaxID=7719 RepID=H2XTU8_CIOIN